MPEFFTHMWLQQQQQQQQHDHAASYLTLVFVTSLNASVEVSRRMPMALDAAEPLCVCDHELNEGSSSS